MMLIFTMMHVVYCGTFYNHFIDGTTLSAVSYAYRGIVTSDSLDAAVNSDSSLYPCDLDA